MTVTDTIRLARAGADTTRSHRAGLVVATLATRVSFLVVPWLALAGTGSLTWAALAVTGQTVAYLAGCPLGAALADRFPPAGVALAADLTGMAVLTGLAFAYADPVPLLLLAALLGAVRAGADRARDALPEPARETTGEATAPPREGLIATVTFLGGAAIGAVAALLGPLGALWLTALSYGAGAALTVLGAPGHRVTPEVTPAAGTDRPDGPVVNNVEWSESPAPGPEPDRPRFRHALGDLLRTPLIRWLAVALCLANVLGQAGAVVLVAGWDGDLLPEAAAGFAGGALVLGAIGAGAVLTAYAYQPGRCVIEGLHDGNVALLGKIHHAAVDGVSGAELFVHLFDLTPEPAPRPGDGQAPPRPEPERIPSSPELVGYALWSQMRRTVQLPGLIGRTVGTATHLARRRRDPAAVVGALPLQAPRTPWSGAITAHRTVAFARVKLSDVRKVRAAFGVKVNDVVLALTASALRHYLADHDTLPADSLVAMVPVSVRTEDEHGRTDNRISGMFVRLHTEIEDVAERLTAIALATRGAKEDHQAVDAKFLQNWAEHAAPATFALATRLYSQLNIADRHPPLYNLVVSNVPGPDFPLYLDGAELVATYPMGPVSEGAGLNVTVLSYLDNVDFGFLACTEQVPDVNTMAADVELAMAELLAAQPTG